MQKYVHKMSRSIKEKKAFYAIVTFKTSQWYLYIQNIDMG